SRGAAADLPAHTELAATAAAMASGPFDDHTTLCYDYPKRTPTFASAPSASSAAVTEACSIGRRPTKSTGRGWSQTLLTVRAVFSRVARNLMALLPARPSRLNVVSMPSARSCTRPAPALLCRAPKPSLSNRLARSPRGGLRILDTEEFSVSRTEAGAS